MKTSKQLLALPNSFPYNEMLFDGKLKLDDLAVKTRSYDPGFRGPVLLYTSGSIAHYAAIAHGYNPKEYVRPAVVGVGNLDHVRQLNRREINTLVLQFHNVASIRKVDPSERFGVVPNEFLPYGLFFRDLKRFDEPIEFTAAPGPVRMVKVPLAKVVDALAKNGVKVEGDKLIYSVPVSDLELEAYDASMAENMRPKVKGARGSRIIPLVP